MAKEPYEFSPWPEVGPMTREIIIEESRTEAGAAVVKKVDGIWKAVRLDGAPTITDRMKPVWVKD